MRNHILANTRSYPRIHILANTPYISKV